MKKPITLLLVIILAGGLPILADVVARVCTRVPNPIDTPGQGTYGSAQTVALTDTSYTGAGLYICYTTDGSTPWFNGSTCGNGTHYTGTFSTGASTVTIKYIACGTNYSCSELQTSVYTITSAGTWTHIADCTGNGGLTCVFASNPTQHDTVLIYLGSTPIPSPQPTCVDGNSNSYTVSATHGQENGVGFTAYVAYILDAPANANKTITCTATGAGYNDTHGSEFRLTGGTPLVDAAYGSADGVTSDPSTGAISTPTFTPAVAGSLAFCGVLPNSGISAPTGGGTLDGWTGAVNANSATEYKLSAAASSTSARFTDSSNSDSYASVCIVVKP